MKPIADAWKMYRKNVVPKNAGPIQLSETEQAFYAGAHTVYVMLVAMSKWKPEVSEKFVGLLDKEMQEYRAKVEYEALMEKITEGGK